MVEWAGGWEDRWLEGRLEFQDPQLYKRAACGIASFAVLLY